MQIDALFITRNYPPKIGGLENYSFNIIKEFESRHRILKITLSYSIAHLIWFLPFCFFKTIYLAARHSIRIIHICDGMLAPLGLIVKKLTGIPVSITIHGLDIIYQGFFYQQLVPRCVARLDKIICVSQSTLAECTRRGIPIDKCTVIPNGIIPDDACPLNSRDDLRGRLEKMVGVSLQDKKILVTVGRLVKRKGVAWFIENVMPRLDSTFCYFIIGDGPEFKKINALLNRHHLRDRVFMLGRVLDEIKNLVMNASDIFIMPNVTVPGDIEGFGIVAIEAGSCGLPVIASKIQGIQDAVLEGRTGNLVPERDADGFQKKIRQADFNRAKIRDIVHKTFNWTQIYKQYKSVLL